MTTTVTTTTEAPEKRYQVFTEACSWEDARKKCEAAGGHLAYITSEEDWAKVINALNGTGLKYVWLGGTTSISADETRITATWLDGSSISTMRTTGLPTSRPDGTFPLRTNRWNRIFCCGMSMMYGV